MNPISTTSPSDTKICSEGSQLINSCNIKASHQPLIVDQSFESSNSTEVQSPYPVKDSSTSISSTSNLTSSTTSSKLSSEQNLRLNPIPSLPPSFQASSSLFNTPAPIEHKNYNDIEPSSQLSVSFTPPEWVSHPPKSKLIFLEIIREGTIIDTIFLHPQNKVFTLIGSLKGYVDLLYEHPTVSRKHGAFLFDKEGQLYFIDLNSRHGSYKNNTLMNTNEYNKVNVGDQFQFGDIHSTHRRFVLNETKPSDLTTSNFSESYKYVALDDNSLSSSLISSSKIGTPPSDFVSINEVPNQNKIDSDSTTTSSDTKNETFLKNESTTQFPLTTSHSVIKALNKNQLSLGNESKFLECMDTFSKDTTESNTIYKSEQVNFEMCYDREEEDVLTNQVRDGMYTIEHLEEKDENQFAKHSGLIAFNSTNLNKKLLNNKPKHNNAQCEEDTEHQNIHDTISSDEDETEVLEEKGDQEIKDVDEEGVSYCPSTIDKEEFDREVLYDEDDEFYDRTKKRFKHNNGDVISNGEEDTNKFDDINTLKNKLKLLHNEQKRLLDQIQSVSITKMLSQDDLNQMDPLDLFMHQNEESIQQDTLHKLNTKLVEINAEIHKHTRFLSFLSS